MMESAQACVRNHDRIRRRLLLDEAAIRRVLIESIVNAILVVITHVVTNQPTEVLFVQRNDVVEDLAAATPHPAFRNPVLPGRPDARALGLQPCRLQESDDVGVELRIAVQDGVPIGAGVGERFAQLLDHPFRRGMASDVKVQNFAAPMFDDEEAVEQLECDRRHRKEVERHDDLAMVL